MNFIELHWDDPTLFQDNLAKLASNIFKIKYFYEEDQLEILSRNIIDPVTRAYVVQGYQEAANKATIYLKANAAFLDGSATLPKDEEHFGGLLEYFTVKEVDLTNFELDDSTRFIEWLENHEYSDAIA